MPSSDLAEFDRERGRREVGERETRTRRGGEEAAFDDQIVGPSQESPPGVNARGEKCSAGAAAHSLRG